MKKAALDVHAVLSVPAVLAGAMPLRARHHTPWGCRSKFTEIYRNLPRLVNFEDPQVHDGPQGEGPGAHGRCVRKEEERTCTWVVLIMFSCL